MLAPWIFACTPNLPVSDDASPNETAEETGDSQPESAWPATLAETGLYEDIPAETLASGVLPYNVTWPLWSDSAEKDRFLWLPEGSVIDTSDPDYWSVPIGTKAWKTFTRDGIRVETRYIVRESEESWTRVAYIWREDGSDADAAPYGEANARGTDHDVPDQLDCRTCHRTEGLIGVNAVQLGVDDYDTWQEAGLLSDDIAASRTVPGDDIESGALGYLHGNCSFCHRDGSIIADAVAFRLRVLVGTESPADSLAYLTAINAPTVHQDTTSVAIAPGNPSASQIYERMSDRTGDEMPPLGTEVVDTAAITVIGDWISSLPSE